MADRFEQLLECLLQIVGRATISEERVREIVASGTKRIKAFNLCDGTRTLKEIARGSHLDTGNLSRSATRWVQSGVAFWVGDGKDARLLHLYPVAASKRKARRAGNRPPGH